MAAAADGEQQSPGEQSVGVELRGLRAQRGPAAVRPRVRVREHALKELHGAAHVLRWERNEDRRSGWDKIGVGLATKLESMG